jgi:hypothetical protein
VNATFSKHITPGVLRTKLGLFKVLKVQSFGFQNDAFQKFLFRSKLESFFVRSWIEEQKISGLNSQDKNDTDHHVDSGASYRFYANVEVPTELFRK